MGAPLPITTRSVTPADALVWQDLREALWSDEQGRHANDIASFFAGTLNEPNAVLLAETPDGDVVGLVELSLRSDIPGLLGQQTGYVEGLYVLPSHRFHGVARRLLESSKVWARQTGCLCFASDREDRVIVDRSFENSSLTERS